MPSSLDLIAKWEFIPPQAVMIPAIGYEKIQSKPGSALITHTIFPSKFSLFVPMIISAVTSF
jgi:hypothetical protein